jgi:hypothetical protein
MSNKSDSELSISKLSRKIIRNTLTTNPNNLQQIDNSESRFSQFNQSGRNCSSILIESGNFLDTESFFTDLQLFRGSLKEVNLSKVSESVEDLGRKMEDVINNAPEGFVFTLPSGVVSVPSLTISSSVTLKGSPGTVLTVTNPGIKITQPSKSGILSVVFSELSFTFTSTSSKNRTAMISVECFNADIEISDCTIRANSGGEPCFEVFSSDFSGFHSKLSLNSCNVEGFHEVCKFSEGTELEAVKCHFMGCSGSAICGILPKSLIISHTLVEKCRKNGIELQLSSETSPLSTRSTKTSPKRPYSRLIKIDHSDILHNLHSGLLINSDSFSEHNYSILLESNKFAHNKREGLAIKHVSIASLQFINNDFSKNHLTGCWLQKVCQLSSEPSFVLSSNRFLDSFLGYGIYLYATCVRMDQNECLRNALGGIMIAGNCEQSAFDIGKPVCITSCFIQANGESGVQVTDYSNCVSIDRTRIVDNSRHGLVFQSSGSRAETEQAKQFIEVNNCEVSNNSEFAAVVVQCKCSFSNVAMVDNKKGLFQVAQGSEAFVKLDDEQKEAFESFVEVKSQNACRAVCNLF